MYSDHLLTKTHKVLWEITSKQQIVTWSNFQILHQTKQVVYFVPEHVSPSVLHSDWLWLALSRLDIQPKAAKCSRVARLAISDLLFLGICQRAARLVVK